MKDCEEVFAAALLQDMAVPLLAKEKPADYLALLDERAKSGRRLSELEQEKFGFQHSKLLQPWHAVGRCPKSLLT